MRVPASEMRIDYDRLRGYPDLYRCSECCGVVEEYDTENHAEYHRKWFAWLEEAGVYVEADG